MKRLYFIRHGLSENNKLGLISGTTETPLAAEGRKQAKIAGESAKELGIDCIVCSPQGRAQETAKIIAKEIGYPEDKIHINKLFVERDFGELEGTPWAPDMNMDGVSDIETLDTILERAKLAHAWLHELPANNILVVSHGAFGRALRSIILPQHTFHNGSSGGAKKDGLPNAEIVQWI